MKYLATIFTFCLSLFAGAIQAQDNPRFGRLVIDEGATMNGEDVILATHTLEVQ